MKKLITPTILSLVLAFFISCNKEDSLSKQDTISRNMTIEIIKQKNFINKNTIEQSSQVGLLTINLINEESNIIDFEFSEELIEFIGLPKEEVYDKIYEQLDNEGYLTKKNANKLLKKESEYRQCINGCKDKYTDENGDKIKGRGWCKAGCFGQAVVDAVVVAIPVAIALVLK